MSIFQFYKLNLFVHSRHIVLAQQTRGKSWTGKVTRLYSGHASECINPYPRTYTVTQVLQGSSYLGNKARTLSLGQNIFSRAGNIAAPPKHRRYSTWQRRMSGPTIPRYPLQQHCSVWQNFLLVVQSTQPAGVIVTTVELICKQI